MQIIELVKGNKPFACISQPLTLQVPCNDATFVTLRIWSSRKLVN